MDKKTIGLKESDFNSLYKVRLTQLEEIVNLENIALLPTKNVTSSLHAALTATTIESTISQFEEIDKDLQKIAFLPRNHLTSQLKASYGSISKENNKQFDAVDNSLRSIAAISAARLEEMLKNTCRTEIDIPHQLIENLKLLSSIGVSYEANGEASELVAEKGSEYISALDGFNKENMLDWINKWCEKILNFPSELRQKQPALYLLYSAVLVSIIWKIILMPILQESVKQQVFNYTIEAYESPNENIKEIKRSLSYELSYGHAIIHTVRVTNRATTVYRSDKKSSGVIDKLPSHKPVIILNKERNWSFVLYRNHLNEEVTGWVFTGNLAK